MSNKLRDLCTIHSFRVRCQPSPNPKIIEIIGGVFRDYQRRVLGAFCSNLDAPSVVHAKALAVIKVIELAWLHACHNVWIETDSLLVTQFFRSPHLVPWCLRIDWQNCLHRLQCMSFKISHIFREGNHAADASANHDALGSGFTWRDTALSFILSFYHRD
ncbi:unnamed protein product, partial [Prunus brigantina]